MREIHILGSGYAEQVRLHVDEEIDGHPLWISRFVKTKPEALEKTFSDFLDVGVDVINTLTYQASLSGFKECLGLNEAEGYDLFKESVRIARKAIEKYATANPNARKPKVAGSVGSYGACLGDGSEYSGKFIDEVEMDEVKEWHRPRISALVEEGVDFLAFETIPALEEAKALLALAKDFPTQKVWVSFQCKDSERTAYGDNFKQAVKECWAVGGRQLVAVGCNCVNPNFVAPLFSGINANGRIDFPLIAYPNSGEDYSPEKRWHGDSKWDNFEEKVATWLDLGVTFLGSCCRTDISYLKKNKAAVEKWQKRNK